MNVDFIQIININNANLKAQIIAGKYFNYAYSIFGENREILLNFEIDISDINLSDHELFCETISNYQSAELKFGDQSIEYDYDESSVWFYTNNIDVKLQNTFAPECFREIFESLFVDQSDSDYQINSNLNSNLNSNVNSDLESVFESESDSNSNN